MGSCWSTRQCCVSPSVRTSSAPTSKKPENHVRHQTSKRCGSTARPREHLVLVTFKLFTLCETATPRVQAGALRSCSSHKPVDRTTCQKKTWHPTVVGEMVFLTRNMRKGSVSLCKPCQQHLTQETESSGKWRQAPTTSDGDGVSPSHPRAGRFSRRESAKALAAAQARMEDQRWW